MDVISTLVTYLRDKGHNASAAKPATEGVYATVEDTQPVGVATVSHSVRIEVYSASASEAAIVAANVLADCEQLPQIGWWGVVKAPSPAPTSPQGLSCWDTVLEYVD